MTKIATIEMEVKIANYFNIRANLIVPNVSWGVLIKTVYGYESLHECDILVLSKNNYATEVEIKVTKADLLKDKEKRHGHVSNIIARLFFAVPEKLKDLALQEIPERAGLLVVYHVPTEFNINRLVVEMERNCKRNTNGIKWSEEDRYQLARLGAMRIWALKSKFVKKVIK